MTTQTSPLAEGIELWTQNVLSILKKSGIRREEAEALFAEQLKRPLATNADMVRLVLHAWQNVRPLSRMVLDIEDNPADTFARHFPTTTVNLPDEFLRHKQFEQVFTSGRPATAQRVIEYYCGPIDKADDAVKERCGKGVFCADMLRGDYSVREDGYVALFALLQCAAQNWLFGCRRPIVAPQFFWRGSMGVQMLMIGHTTNIGRMITGKQLAVTGDYAPIADATTDIFYVR